MMKSHCQPFMPRRPSNPSSSPETGAPITAENGTAAMNKPTIRARYAAGNHSVRKKMMPGKNPASAIPSSTRTT